jgi:hypothetical protein
MNSSTKAVVHIDWRSFFQSFWCVPWSVYYYVLSADDTTDDTSDDDQFDDNNNDNVNDDDDDDDDDDTTDVVMLTDYSLYLVQTVAVLHKMSFTIWSLIIQSSLIIWSSNSVSLTKSSYILVI